MAEFALGLTKTAVEGTVSRVKLAIDEETKLRIRVQNDLVFITGEFEMMQSFLNAANIEQVNNQVVSTWVRQIRDLAFDVEDCLEFVVHLDTNKPWAWLWRVMPSCLAPPQPVDEAVAEIQCLKARVEDVSHRNTRYNLISDCGSNSSNRAAALFSKLPAQEFIIDAGASAAAAFHILSHVWEATGKKRPKMDDLKKLITNEGSDLEMISLWSSPGSAANLELGVAHIMEEAYNDPEICQQFQSIAWVKLMHPFSLDEFLKSLITQLYATSSQYQPNLEPCFRTMEEYHLIKAQIMQQLRQQRYLVIVEELSTVLEWKAIKKYLPDSKNGSRVVVRTPQLGLALFCTGKPYQVSELIHYSHGQSLCAFFNKVSGRRSDTSEFIWQLSSPGVISLWEDISGKSANVNKLYNCITHQPKVFDRVKFDRHIWIDVPSPFDMGVFSRRLLFSLHSDDLRAKEITAVGLMGDKAIIEECLRFLHGDNCLVVINCLESTDEWDLIKSTFLSEPTKSCILVLANDDPSLARHCVEEEERALKVEDLEADSLLHHLIKGCEYYEIGGKEASSRGRFFSNRKEEARHWTGKFKNLVPKEGDYELREYLRSPGVIFLCGVAVDRKSAVARRIYYDQLLTVREGDKPHTGNKHYSPDGFDFGFTKYSWAHVPHPFNLTDLCWRFLLDFHSDDPHAKETTAVGLMNGSQDPIQGCLKFLCQDKCFLVIDGLRSPDDWNLIKAALLSEPSKGCILVITNEASVAAHQQGRVIDFKGPEAYVAYGSLIKNKSYSDQRTSVFSSRMVEASGWLSKFELIGHVSEWRGFCNNLMKSTPRVISIWGIAGVGKSTMVRSIYYTNMLGLDQNRPSLSFGGWGCLTEVTKYSWVDVPHPFSLADLSRRLLLDFHSDDLEAKETEAVGMIEGQDPIQQCRKFMREDKCFVVIDGLHSTDEWDLINDAFLSEPIKGCILVITNEENVAMHCVDKEDQVINVKGLEADAALDLFTKIAWGSEQLTPEEKKLSILTTTKCGGLPKVIAAIGEYMHSFYRPQASMEQLHRLKKERLEIINANFMGMLEIDPEFHNLRGLFSWMRSYFEDCFLQDSLKPCIFYLSVFPLAHNIRRRRLLRRWIAEGYSRDTSGSTAEENGEKFFSELVKLSIIQPQESASKKVMCQVNGFFREYIISRPMEDNLVFTLEGHCGLNSQRHGQHLTISRSWDRTKIVLESMDLSRLRSFTVFGEWKSFFISADVSMGLLRVLDLEDTSGVKDGDVEQFGKLLPRLKFLSLRGCEDITHLPSSLGGLKQLQTLDIKGTSIVKVPHAILKLEKLQYFRAGNIHRISTSSENDCSTVAGIAIPPAAEGDGASTSQQPVTASAAAVPQPVDGDSAACGGSSTPWSSRPCGGLAFSWLSKLHRHGLGSSAHDGVQFSTAAIRGIGKLTALHTLGVVNVGGAGGKAVLTELKKLVQLRKLRLSGINRKNWLDFCFTISGHDYLESLSVRLDKDERQDHQWCLSDISKPPNNLKSLKLYGGNVQVSPVWIKQLHDLTKVDLEEYELMVSTQEDIDSLMEVPCWNLYRHICVKPIQDGELRYGWWENNMDWFRFLDANVLKIDCDSYKLGLVFGPLMADYVEVLVIHCSTTEASLDLSGLDKVRRLKEVWLKGSYSDAVKQHLQQKLEESTYTRVVLKLEEQPRPS